MANILDLPPEIISAIITQMPGSAIKSLRASCRQLHYHASPLLYPVLYLSCHQLDLDVFRLVVNDPHLLSGVQELVIDDTTLAPSFSNWRVYHAVACRDDLWPDRKRPYFSDGEVFDEPDREWSHGPNKTLWELFMLVFKGHHENRLAHADISALKDALPKMRSLRSLVITNRTADEEHATGAQSRESSSPVVKMWRRLGTQRRERQPFPPRCDWWTAWGSTVSRVDDFTLDWLDDELERNINVSGLPYVDESHDQDHGEDSEPGHYLQYNSVRSIARETRGLLVALEVLGEPSIQPQLKEFRVDASHDILDEIYQPGLPIRIFNHISPLTDPIVTGFAAANNLSKFHLVISNGHKYWDGEDTLQQGHVARLLASVPQLEELVFEAHAMSTVAAIPEDLTFKRLRRVEFSCGDMVPATLKAFLERHSGTLEELRIEYCNIDPGEQEGKWEDVVRDISSLQGEGVTKLQTAILWLVYDFKPFTGCGKNNTMELDSGEDDKIYSWTYGVDDSLRLMLDED
ncbi:hypothetical protein QQZ08_007555 [Neonectria magnoliae]|uniref:F-box domain-containing protein n=1 Tax=Neonectria magnoliae TaxID=2732573 RepID=A0ABR1HZB0_9HYPO